MSDSPPQTAMPGGIDLLAGRQPLLDRSEHLVGWELDLQRGRGEALDHYRAVSSLLRDETLTTSKPIFLRMGLTDVLAGHAQELPKDRVVLCVPGSGRPAEELVETYSHLTKRGYRLALNGLGEGEGFRKLLGLVSFVRIDLGGAVDEDRLGSAVAALHRYKLRVIGTGVEDTRQRVMANRLKIDLCQGYYFLKPTILPRSEVKPVTFNYMELIAKLNSSEVDFKELEAIIKSDISLSTQLLKYLNSPMVGLRERVSSLHQALVLLGETEVRKWTSTLVMAQLSDGKPEHLSMLSLVRGRFCETVADLMGRSEIKLAYYLTGLLSLLEVITSQSADELTMSLGLSRKVRLALLGSKSEMGRVLSLARACERGDGVAAAGLCGGLGLDPWVVIRAYSECLAWGEELHLGSEGSVAAA
ncbi:MAG: HDOD domain-containing protein [Phycisphaeraceae bacterium]